MAGDDLREDHGVLEPEALDAVCVVYVCVRVCIYIDICSCLASFAFVARAHRLRARALRAVRFARCCCCCRFLLAALSPLAKPKNTTQLLLENYALVGAAHEQQNKGRYEDALE
jgi:hypothetical protein